MSDGGLFIQQIREADHVNEAKNRRPFPQVSKMYDFYIRCVKSVICYVLQNSCPEDADNRQGRIDPVMEKVRPPPFSFETELILY